MTTPTATEVDTLVATSLSMRPGPSARPTEVVLRAARPRAVLSAATPRPAAHAPVAATEAPATPIPTRKPTPKPTPRPTPKQTPKPTPVAQKTSVNSNSREQVEAQIRDAWGGDDDKAVRVADCESGLNPRASSPNEINLGLWQVTKQTWKDYGGPGDDPRKASASVQTHVAWRMFGDRGWSPWPGCA